MSEVLADKFDTPEEDPLDKALATINEMEATMAQFRASNEDLNKQILELKTENKFLKAKLDAIILILR